MTYLLAAGAEQVVDELCQALSWSLQWKADEIAFLEDLAEEQGYPPPALADRPVLGPEHVFVWRAFWDLEATRTSNGYGLNPIAWAEIDAWARLNGVAIEPWELRAIRRLDGVRLKHAADEQERREKAAAKGK